MTIQVNHIFKIFRNNIRFNQFYYKIIKKTTKNSLRDDACIKVAKFKLPLEYNRI